ATQQVQVHQGHSATFSPRGRVDPFVFPPSALWYAVQPLSPATRNTVTRSLVIRTSQSRWQRGQRNQARCIDATSASAPPRAGEGPRLAVQPQLSCGQAT